MAATWTIEGQAFRIMASKGAGIATRLRETVLHPLSIDESFAMQAFVNVRAIVVKIWISSATRDSILSISSCVLSAAMELLAIAVIFSRQSRAGSARAWKERTRWFSGSAART